MEDISAAIADEAEAVEGHRPGTEGDDGGAIEETDEFGRSLKLLAWKPLQAHTLSPAQRAAIQELMERGDMSWMMHPEQNRLLKWLDERPREVAVLCVNRQWGKTLCLLAYCVAFCMKNPRSTVLFVAPHLDHLDKIILVRINQIFSFMSDDQVPLRRQQAWFFRNGSILRIDGVAVGRGVRVRGDAVHLCVMDECRDMPELNNIVESHIFPMFSTTNGRLILSSTPPDSVSHAFTEHYIHEAIQRGDFFHATYKQNPLLPTDRLRYLVNVLHVGGELNPTFRREYMADYSVTDPDKKVIREWNEAENDEFFDGYEGPGPQVVRPYTGLDYAHADPCGIICGYFHPGEGCLIIEEEHFERHMSTLDVGLKIGEMERRVLSRIPRRMDFIRVMDVDPLLMADLYSNHNLRFEPAMKTTSNTAMINRLRIVVAEGKLRVNPRCVQLKYQLRTGVFNAKQNDYLRTDRTGHLDLVDAAKYLCLNVRFRELLHQPPPERSLRHDQMRIGGFVGTQFKGGVIDRPT